MKNLDLNAYGVEEINVVEMKEIEGGIIPIIIIGFLVLGTSSCATYRQAMSTPHSYEQELEDRNKIRIN